MKLQDKVIITAALTGVAANRKQCPSLPYTPDEIAEEAYRAYQAGASVVHIHARENDGTPSHRVEVYKEILEKTRKKCDILLNFSTGAVNVPKEDRIKHISELKPEIGALNMGSMNYAKYNSEKKNFVFDWCFENKFETIQFYLNHMNTANVKPELECFDAGHTESIWPLIDIGILKRPIQFSFIMGVLGGFSAKTKNLVHQVSLIPDDSTWEVIGISHDQWKMIAAALSMGGNIRVGLEDNFYVEPNKMANSNADLVEKAVRLSRDIGREPATTAEARELLGFTKNLQPQVMRFRTI
ncbi:MAG: 3-keto-5-aminohexanoate cleavage protein [Deltaproteobacteria bacterium]|nr:3-keto-5-aminohexanoate cleavage protein [Deltaproteobacteria bacterium]